MKKIIMLVFLITLCVLHYIQYDRLDQDPYLITDYSRLHPVKVARVVKGKEEGQLIDLLQEAKNKHLTVSIAGQRHSQGGHTYYKDGMVVDMTAFRRILSFDPEAMKIRVQAGATWKDIQDYINPYGLSLKTMQSQNIFTVGGSVSINAHGRDIRNGSMINSVDSFRLLTADGQIKEVSRTHNAELFPLALGGYGLFGIIIDITLTLTEDEAYRITMDHVSVNDYSRYFLNEIKADPDIQMHIARISVAPDSFLDEMYTMNYKVDKTIPLEKVNKLKNREDWVVPGKLLFQMNRSYDWGKNVYWKLQKQLLSSQEAKIISRNNAMNANSAFMEYSRTGYNDLLQEYFIPIDQFGGFVQRLKKVLQAEEINLLNITVRYVNEDNEAMLSYARAEMFGLVCLFHVPLSEQKQKAFKQSIEKVIDEVIEHQGTYYLPYVSYPSREQFQTVYPLHKTFFEMKDRYDPDHLFMNHFYQQYKGE